MQVLGPIHGFPVIFFPMPNRICTVRVVANATGSNWESQREDYGVAHFLEHMFFKRTKHKDRTAIAMELDRLGTHNAYTNFADTKFFIDCRRNRWKDAMNLLSEMLFEADFDPAEFETEKQVILTELATGLDDPQTYFSNTAYSDCYTYPGTETKLHPVIGHEDTVSNLTTDHLINHRQNLYSKSNLLFIFAGDLNADEITAYCTETLGKYANTPQGEKREKHDLVFNPAPFNAQHNAEQGIFTFAWEGYTEEQSVENNIVDMVFSSGFGGISCSLLYERIRQDLGMCYAVGMFRYGIGRRSLNLAYGMTHPKNIAPAIEEVHQLMRTVMRQGLGEQRLQIVKDNLAHHFEQSTESAHGYAESFGDRYLSRKFHLSLEEILAKIEKVKDQDVAAYAEWLYAQPSKCMTLNSPQQLTGTPS